MRSIPEPYSRKCQSQSFEEIEQPPRAEYSRDIMRPCHEMQGESGPESEDLWPLQCQVLQSLVSYFATGLFEHWNLT